MADDGRLDRLVDLLVDLAAGRRDARMATSAAADAVDAVVSGVNMLAEELEAAHTRLEERVSERTAELERTRVELERRVLFDPLTGLASRTLLLDRLRQVRDGRGAEVPTAVLVLDLDGFKQVNDSLGHDAGDRLLAEVATRLSALARSTDTVCRLGGDEFALLVAAPPEGVLQVAHRVLEAVRRPVRIDGQLCWVTTSVGVCLTQPGRAGDTLLRDADTAMYVAKALGPGRVQVFEPAMHAAALSLARTAEQLRAGLPDQLRLHYQPVVDLGTERTAGVEALVRWQHPEQGLVAPTAFIDVAEDSGVVVPLGAWVRETALAQLARWRAGGVVDETFVVHVNCSPIELRSVGFAADVVDAVARHGLTPAQLVLEITETQVLAQDAQTAAAVDALRRAGVGMAVDDFGTGYSSLSYLRNAAVDVVKLDRSLVTGLDHDPQQHRVVAAVLALVAAHDLEAVAEGVETRAEADSLRALGCRQGQGFLWGRPVPADELAAGLTGPPTA